MAVYKDLSTLIGLLQLGADSVDMYNHKDGYVNVYLHYPTLELVEQAKALLLLVNKRREVTPLLEGKEEKLTVKVRMY